MRVLVTGATGFVAGHLVPQLVRAGHEVVAAGHDPARLARFADAEPVVVDLRQREIDQLLPGRMDAVIHLAQANVPFPEGVADLFEVNVGSTQRLLDYARRAGAARFVYASTGSVYGGGERPWREEDRAEGQGYYAATRQAAERLVQAYGNGLPFTILRLFTPYGPGQHGRLVPVLLGRVRQGQPVTLREGGRPRGNPIFVTHVADVCEQALHAVGNQVVNAGGDEILSIRDMAEIIGRVLDQPPAFEDVPGASGGDVVGDITRLRQLYRLPERLTTFAEGVRVTLSDEC